MKHFTGIYAFLVCFTLNISAFPQDFDQLKSCKLYNIQMHIHGHSHHNASLKPASIQWHTHQAKDFDVDILWWTEHDGMLNQKKDFRIDFKDATVDSRNWIIYNRESNFLPEFIEAHQLNGKSKVEIINDSIIFLQLSHLSGNEAILSLSPRTSKGKLAGFRLPRPISSHAVLNFNIIHFFDSPKNAIKVQVKLSWHINEIPHQHRIEYILSDTVDSKSFNLINSEVIRYYLPIRKNYINYYSLSLYDDARKLKFGGDNTITDLVFELISKDQSTSGIYLSEIVLSSSKPEPEHQIEMTDKFSKDYELIYDIKGISGIEYSPFRMENFSPHFNLFMPTSKLSYTQMTDVFPKNKFDYNILIDHVHQQGGLVSFNHIFGTSTYPHPQYNEETQNQLVDSIATLYMNENLFNTDILEVGYLTRGGVSLNNHLKIWDIFTANGYFLYGNGTTDAHGGLWKGEIPNPFTTWVWSKNAMDTSIINALKSGRFYFGTLHNNIHKFFFSIDNYNMGDLLYTDKLVGNLSMFIEPEPYNYTFRLIQGAIDFPGSDIHYINRFTFDPKYPPVLDLSNSCFIRLEIEGYMEDVLLYSNPIILLKNKDNPGTIYENRIIEEQENSIELELYNPYPNPAIEEVWIPFKLNIEQSLSFKIVSSDGKLIHKINLGKRTKGEYLSKLGAIYWDLMDTNGIKVNSGLYFISADNFDHKINRKIIVR